MATVIDAVYAFCDKMPDAWIFASGSTSSRTRLYRMGITKYLHEMLEDFDVYGELKDTWEPFEKGKNYVAFLAQ